MKESVEIYQVTDMPKKKCSACGSIDTIKIIYGLPTFEAVEVVERGEFIVSE